jgi:hypothetical protein
LSTRVFTFYNLRPDVDVADFLDWSRAVDQPTCARMPACHSFEVFLVKREVNGILTHQVIEVIDVESWDAWQETLTSEAFAQVSNEWPRYADETSLVSVQADRI